MSSSESTELAPETAHAYNRSTFECRNESESATVITCPACGKQNQDHYRFCLGCGAELPRGGAKDDESSPGIADEGTHSGGEPTPVPEAPVAKPAPAVAEAPAAGSGLPPGKCPECGYVNPPTNRFCASCGFRLDEAKKVAASPAAVVDDDEGGAVLIALDPEGNEVGRHSLAAGESIIGRESGSVFGGDNFLSPQHARFTSDAGKVTVEDLGSLNGVFRKLIAEQRSKLVSGQRFRIGQELLQYDALDPTDPDEKGVSVQGTAIEGWVGRVSLVVGRETIRPSYPVSERGIDLGRERGEVLFPEDGYVSGLHCKISCEDGDAYVTDLGSSNGTFVQVIEKTDLRNGDVLLMGQQLFRIAI